jgi:hypothetical protein
VKVAIHQFELFLAEREPSFSQRCLRHERRCVSQHQLAFGHADGLRIDDLCR